MKPEYPILWAKISMIIAVPIVAITLIFYVSYAFTRTSSDLYSMALTAFGTTAILSSVCFGMASTNTDDSLFKISNPCNQVIEAIEETNIITIPKTEIITFLIVIGMVITVMLSIAFLA